MGRKIPGRKHRGVKDPEKQKAERLAKVKDKINAPPSNPDDQQVSKTLSRIIDLKNRVKEGAFNKKKKKKDEKHQKENKFKGKPEKLIPQFKQYPDETDRQFKQRMDRICSDVVREAAFEDKYHIDIKRNEKGEVEGIDKRPKDELEVLIKKLRKEKTLNKNKKGKKKKIKSKDNEEPRLTKSQKWALKKAEKKKTKKSLKEESFEPQREQVKFGDIVHAPPTLVTPKRTQKSDGAPRPGQKQLLLKSMITNENNNYVKLSTGAKNGVPKATKTINKKGKRKELPNALRRQLDKQQREVIDAYKALKSKKYSIAE